MSFAYALQWWTALLVGAVALTVAWLAYRRLLVPLTPGRRAGLVALRASTLIVLALLLFRPSGLRLPAGARDAVVPVLVDTSRSMRIPDASDGRTRLQEAIGLVHDRLEPALGDRVQVEPFTFSGAVAPGLTDEAAPDGGVTDLAGALRAVRERYRGRPLAAVVVITDGADTGRDQESVGEGVAPVFAVGVGSADGFPDLEVTSAVAGEPRLDQSSVDIRLSAVSRGLDGRPFSVRLTHDGQPVETRSLTPAGDGSPVDASFTVAPAAESPTVYTVEIPPAEDEIVTENNSRSVLVPPAGRTRRVLAIEGAPGFEHSFLARAWARDRSLEVDTIVRKGQNDEGQDTFFVQAAPQRSPALLGGFPAAREDLYVYDAVVLSNIEADFFTRAQLLLLGNFVAERGGGLLVTGGRSFAGRGYAGTPLEPALPVELSDRRGALARSDLAARSAPGQLLLTPEGAQHPIMRLGVDADETRKQWADVPPLAAVVPLGALRPGASLLAAAAAEGGGVQPLVAVQPYGQGRTMVFAGEASWRWRMLLPSTDDRYERFWRQTTRWLAAASPDPVTVDAPTSADAGVPVTIGAVARTRGFEPAPDAQWTASVTRPDGSTQPLMLRPADAASGRFEGAINAEAPGLYRVQVEAHRGDVSLGSADRWFLVGGVDREFSDPRLDEALLARIARASGGRYVAAADIGSILDDLRSAAPPPASPERYDLWQNGWVMSLIVALISAEWVLRRKWGLR